MHIQYTITECGKVYGKLNYGEFVDFYFKEFGYDCGSPHAIVSSLTPTHSTYLGKGFSVTMEAIEDAVDCPAVKWCSHPKKYTQKHLTFQFDYCPDCKKEV